MRVLTVIDSLILAGAEALVKDTIPLLRKRGIDVSLAVLKQLPESPFEIEMRDRRVPFVRTAPGGIYSPTHIFSLAREIPKFDVVHVRLFPALLWAPLGRKWARSRVPMVMSAEATVTNRGKLPLDRHFEQWMHSQYEVIAAASEGIAETLEELVPKCADRIRVVWNGADIGRFRNAKPYDRSKLFDNGDPILIYTARFDIVKDHLNLIRALSKLDHANLVLVGDGELRAESEKLVLSLGVSGRVRFLGRRSDVAELLKAADVYVHPAYSEGFGLAVIEAMAAGLPVIASDVPGLAQVVADAGTLLPAKNPDALAQAIRRVLDSDEEREQLKEKSVKRASLFGIEQTVDGYIRIYEELLAKSTRH